MAICKQFKLSTGRQGDADDNRERTRTHQNTKSPTEQNRGVPHDFKRSLEGLLPFLTPSRLSPGRLHIVCVRDLPVYQVCLGFDGHRSEAADSTSKVP